MKNWFNQNESYSDANFIFQIRLTFAAATIKKTHMHLPLEINKKNKLSLLSLIAPYKKDKPVIGFSILAHIFLIDIVV